MFIVVKDQNFAIFALWLAASRTYSPVGVLVIQPSTVHFVGLVAVCHHQALTACNLSLI